MTQVDAEVAEAFSRHEFHRTYAHLAPTVRWDVVGDRTHEGSAAVRETCEASAAWLADARTTFTKFDVLTGPDFVVVDSTAEYVTADEPPSVVASCDIYRFAENQLVAITSYTVELPS
ncbi:nuclear transport factor 2 family protein [Asanoa sp. WMMD1127]|uniref:nuclear transport factor 2 family protein n=1 Tax=Asanoa sp. WMMD1127 TaxID=3016107 RepID=UPI0024162229|nr:nuclear transport factor 2 family protein [Asanoa sp. WMMD1127]MDG4824634.1 nuclear transport factor 2 family protein [Asanoa sp. WMMD1127]